MQYHFMRGFAAACIVGAAVLYAAVALAQPVPVAAVSIDLAQTFTEALNAHDVDAIVEMFTDEDSGPTINADRYAWQKFEIRLWAERQVQANIHVVAYDYQVTEHGVAWRADLSRDDFRALGVESVPVSNSIWVHDGKLADFTSVLEDPRDVERLGVLWWPGRIGSPSLGI